MYMCVRISLSLYIYIYNMYVCVSLSLSIYIYIHRYIDRQIDREIERERERERCRTNRLLTTVTCQRSTEVPLRRSALSVCPCGDSWGTPLQLDTSYSRSPVKPPRGQTLRSPRPKVTSMLTPNLERLARGHMEAALQGRNRRKAGDYV